MAIDLAQSLQARTQSGEAVSHKCSCVPEAISCLACHGQGAREIPRCKLIVRAGHTSRKVSRPNYLMMGTTVACGTR